MLFRSITRASNNLYSTWYYMREALNAKDAGGILQKSLGSYGVSIDNIRCDLYEFRKLHNTLSKHCVHVPLYENIARLCSGLYLNGLYYSWAADEQRYFEIEQEKLMVKLASLYRESGEAEKALELLNKAIFNCPFSDEVYKEIITLHISSGNTIAALHHYKKYEESLLSEFGTEPSEQIHSLVEDFL